MGISVVICTKNEEKNIGRCLKSVLSIADEILVLDSKSTDQTAQIVRSFPKAQLVETEWRGFSETKNYGNSLATQDYILSLDADEELTPECQNEILKLKPHLQGVYSLNRLTNYCGHWIRHSGWFPDRHIRLFPREGTKWVGQIHETLQFEEQQKSQNIKSLVNHYTYYSIEEHWARINHYSTLAASEYIRYSRPRLLLSMMINSKMRLIKHYILKLGFLDGFQGLVIAALSAGAVFLKYAKAYQLKQKD